MQPSCATIRACIALFYSGIFWMMVMFVIENRRAQPRQRKLLVPLAVVLMIGSVYLMLGMMTGRDLSATRLDPSTMTSAETETETGRWPW